MPGMFVPIALFVMITISVSLITRLIATAVLNKTIREALRSDPGSVPLLAEKLEQRQPWADSLLGWIMLAFAATLALLALFEEPWERMHMLQAAIVPAVIGITVLLYCRITAPKVGG
jgi:hypothetical protein